MKLYYLARSTTVLSLIFQDGKYRTDGLNPALAIILQKSKGLQKEKTGNIVNLKMSPGMWPELESNQRHKDFQSSALPTELSGQEESRYL
jgi:hypothetical protein